MRMLAAATAILVLVASPAQAQLGGKRPRGEESNRPEEKKPKIDDRAYQDALKRIPDSKEKYDPWAVTKPPDADKKPSK